MHWLGQYIGFGWLWWCVATVYALTILGIIAVVVSENRNPVKSLAWVTVLLVVPMVGLILYIFFGRNIQNKRIISRRNRRILRRLTNRSSPSGEATGAYPQPHQPGIVALRLQLLRRQQG